MGNRNILPPNSSQPNGKGSVLENFRLRAEKRAIARALEPEPLPTQDPIGYIFLLDISGSMEGEPLNEMKGGVQEAVNSLIKESPVTLISFGSEAEVICEETQDPIAIRSSISKLKTSGSTNLTAAFAEATQHLYGKEKVVFHVITDGYPDDAVGALDIAKKLISEGHVIRCSGVTGADAAFLRALAGGEQNQQFRVVKREEFRNEIIRASTLPIKKSD